ncbi:DUF2442 domain-containing protein [Rhizobium acidisoli]|uniref:DUF2442 domain-containing protein n=1 Tax=Rhizobium acidisoli TaxID=1538158 RepID=A0AAE5TWK5_9HYPH|nr:DUF2442 domain-containing protein [Rhizobium acidisoli]KPH05026.1 hypothetical protein AOG23_30005 [Rhizobium acidisoli]QAS78599.1 DUF2442 domain-containing protein [Rhizobium acidisoli]
MVRGRRRRRVNRRDKIGQGGEKSLGSGLDEMGFQPLGRRIVVKTKRDADFPLKHPAPSDAYYDYSSRRIVIEFENGSAFMVPARSLDGLAEASEKDIAGVEVLGETALRWETLELNHEIAMLMAGIFGRPSFMEEIATRAMGRLHNDTQAAEFAAWARPVAEFFSYELPYRREAGWEHYYMTAYEIGCAALVALGQANETVGGAKPRRFPARPEEPPRWDDISIAVIYVAAQNGQLRFRPLDRRVPSLKTDDRGDMPGTNIAAANGAGPARATFNAYLVLEALGLVEGGRWTKAAETVLWRDNPTEWNLDFVSDARFVRAAFDAAAGVPDDIRSEIDAIVTSVNEETWTMRTPNVEKSDKSSPPPDAETVPPATPADLRSMVDDSRCHRLNALFFRRWRLGDGWLSATEAKSALEIYHDALAISMRKAVMGWLYPSRPSLAL